MRIAATSPDPRPGNEIVKRLVRPAVAGEQLLFEIPAPGDQVVPLSARELPALTGQSRFEEVCDREIDIVAAQQDVVADCLALDVRGRAASLRAEFEEAEIRRSTTNVDHQDVVRSVAVVGELARKIRCKIVLLQPAVEGGLRLFKQTNGFRKTGLPARHKRQPLGSRIE